MQQVYGIGVTRTCSPPPGPTDSGKRRRIAFNRATPRLSDAAVLHGPERSRVRIVARAAGLTVNGTDCNNNYYNRSNAVVVAIASPQNDTLSIGIQACTSTEQNRRRRRPKPNQSSLLRRRAAVRADGARYAVERPPGCTPKIRLHIAKSRLLLSQTR